MPHTLKEESDHIVQLYDVPRAYRRRINNLALNIFLTGILAFELAMIEDIKWYWSLAIGVFFGIIMRLFTPFKSTLRRFLKKVNYVERTIKVTALENAGYTDRIDLHAIEISNTMSWFIPLVGFLIGCAGHIVGALIGLGIGCLLAKLLSPKDDKLTASDYRKVSTGWSWVGYSITAILSVAIILFAIVWIVGPSNSESNSAANTNNEIYEEVVEVAVAPDVVEEAVVEEVVADNEVTEKEVIKSLYSIYFGDINAISEDGITPVYSASLKNKFEQLSISQGGDPYTKSFNKVLKDVQEAETSYGTIILDSDLLRGGQEAPSNLDVKITSVKIIDNDNAEVTATVVNGFEMTRTYIMKRENGTFKIDDIIDSDGESTVKWFKNEIKEATRISQNS